MTQTTLAPPTSAFDPEPLSRRVITRLTQQIVGGALAEGTSLPPEPQLADHFGVSRTVIREATRELVNKGLLTVRQGSGTRVRSSQHWNYLDPEILFEQVRSGTGEGLLEEVLEARRLIEVNGAELAARRRTDTEIERLEATVREMRETLDDSAAFGILDESFHQQVTAMASNRVWREAFRQIADIISVGRHITMQRPGGIEQSMRGHEAICKAIHRGDEQMARSAMLDHVRQYEDDMHQGLRLWVERTPQ